MNRCLTRNLKCGIEFFTNGRPDFKQIFNFQKSNYNCWSCKKFLNELETKSQFCPCDKNVILPVCNKINYFELLNIDFNYDIDLIQLTKNFRQKMRKLHPDLFTMKSDNEKKYSAEQSSLVNKAYDALKSPIKRGEYLLGLIDSNYLSEVTESHESDSEKQKILMEIMELNEIIDEIKLAKEVKELALRLKEIIKPFEEELEKAFNLKDYPKACSVISKMKYFKNIDDRVKDLELKFNIENV
ncbi:iron-sulfur cluster co-chaperone mitochondrial [Brachionus plicatilis]|uniref:Iron-sulfur cluster co-chaperone mitochondrial n=1 Tax=Brachionus plicatilis TaxID=10195 RepID=A0A3M7T5Y5_BRAPC|nr:iron-sulfur cluster co-chaperone mitochondrial [Brachionus plicatilis]